MCCSDCRGSLPADFIVTSSTDNLTVSWKTSGNFTVEIQSNPLTTCAWTDTGPCAASGLASGSAYVIKVTNNTDNSVWNNTYYTGNYI